MITSYKFRNDLKTGTGIRRFFQPPNADLLSAPKNYLIGDDKIPNNLKQKNLNLSYSPQSYIISQNAQNEVVLLDICGKPAELPQTLASFRDGEIPEIRINGYALFIDINTRNAINSASPIRKKQDIATIGKIFAHFNKINSMPIPLSVTHELKHLSNRHSLQAICGKIENSGLSAKEFALTRYADEISATAQEFLDCVTEYNQTKDKNTFPEKFSTFRQQLSSPHIQNILHNPQELAVVAAQIWENSPNRDIYTGKHGDFVDQTNQYAEQAQVLSSSTSQTKFSQIINAYLTLNFEGKSIDCSSLMNNISPLAHIYQDANDTMQQRKSLSLSSPHCTRQMRYIKTK